ncbi:heavy metal translocating P-type ATPase [Helicobacter pametensis]|uniref:heavy metal translocating P-type ATPase n=1 Tax=Helicobacter pametensis TaxID=95149 RepID=UPI0004835D10|nr:cation-translocating P-type ATPase [Helicobacter pametensis]
MKEYFYIQGMSCTACSSGIQSALKRKKGVKQIQVDLLNHCAYIEFDESQITLKEIFAFITKLGYKPQKQGVIEKLDAAFLTPKRRIFLACFFTLITVALAMIPMLIPFPPWFDFKLNASLQILSTLIVMHMGRDFYLKGFKTLIALHPTMDTLVALGSGSAFLYSCYSLFTQDPYLYFESVCVILTFVLIGKTIEEKAKTNAQNSLLTLAKLKETSTIRIKEKQEEQILAQDIQVGDILKITPQSLIPADGILIQGSASLNLSSLSGESLPIHKQEGDSLLSGALNLNTTFLMQVTQSPQESAYWKIIDLVQNTLISKPPIAKVVDKISFYFTPSIIILALLAGIFWIITTSDFLFGVQVFCSVLLISCPCALGLATPLALNIASNLASQKGIFFKDAGILERLGKTEIAFFDKTGTLTEQNLHIQDIISLSSNSPKSLLALAASLEVQSQHIIAQSILSYAQTHQIPIQSAQNLCTLEGLGVSGEIANKRYKIGNAKSFTAPIQHIPQSLSVFVGEETPQGDKILGYITFAETIRPQAKACIQALKNQRITPILLSGDSQHNVQKIAQSLEIDFIAGALPQDKLNTIKQNAHQNTMMIGDGINDMPALSCADVSVAIGEGSQGAIASADLVILNNHLSNIPYCISLSRATLANIKQNLIWAFGYNVIMIPIACGILVNFGILFSPMLAASAMTLSSLSVVFNAQRLKKFKG